MAFRDLYPFRHARSQRRGDYAISPSTDGSPAPAFSGPMRREVSAGDRGQYRLALKGMRVKGLPEAVRVGRVGMQWVHGPIWTQKTHIVQKPGWRPTYLKHMDQGVVEVAAGYELTMCTMDVDVPQDLARAMREWRDEVLAAVGFVVAVLDERLAQEVVAEDLLLFDESGNSFGAADQVRQVRAFPPTQRVLEEHRRVLENLAVIDPGRNDRTSAAARWYLRAAQSGVTPDAIVFLWIAVEALSKPPYGTKLSKAEKKLSDVEWLERALSDAGVDPTGIEPSVGRLAGLRAEIVHGGVETPALLREGYYVLEALTRVLIRHRLGSGPVGWPAFPNEPNLIDPLRAVSRLLQRAPRTIWRSGQPEVR